MKILIKSGLILVLMFSFNSCNKCSHCIVTNDIGKLLKIIQKNSGQMRI
jgi:hypothetical protein